MVGKIKHAPGTFASLVTCCLFLFLFNITSIVVIFFIMLITFCYSFVAINYSFEEFDSKDPQEIVIDEVVGQTLVLLGLPIYETLYPLPAIYYCIPAFLLFRLFDIWKPFPINYIDKNIQGSLGIMLDDILASFYSIIILTLIFFFLGG